MLYRYHKYYINIVSTAEQLNLYYFPHKSIVSIGNKNSFLQKLQKRCIRPVKNREKCVNHEKLRKIVSFRILRLTFL